MALHGIFRKLMRAASGDGGVSADWIADGIQLY